MIFNRSFLLLLFAFTYSVVCDNSDNGDRTTPTVGLNVKYKYNHPPTVENYDPIPVAVVYDDESDISGRSTITTEVTKSGDNLEVNVSKDNVTPATEREKTTTVVLKSDKSVTELQEKVKSQAKGRALNNFQVPVNVVYDKSSNNLQEYQKTKLSTYTEAPRRRLVQRRKVLKNNNIDTPTKQVPNKKEDSEIPKVETEKPQVSKTETRTFPKRTGDRDPIVPIIESESYVFSYNGNFHYKYEGADGTKAYSEGKLKKVNDEMGESVVGGYSYTDKEGNDFSLSYTADENGYRPVGAHLPTPPPIPPAIARALEYLATATQKPVTEPSVKSDVKSSNR